jgi:hypothetical protein
VSTNYREKVASLEKKVQSLTDENENLLAQMERRDMQVSNVVTDLCLLCKQQKSISVTAEKCENTIVFKSYAQRA